MVERVEGLGLKAHVIVGTERTVIAAIGEKRARRQGIARKRARRRRSRADPRPLQSRQPRSEARADAGQRRQPDGRRRQHRRDRRARARSRAKSKSSARRQAVKAAGATALRGGAFKPRTSPYSFQGLKEDGLKLLAAAREETGLAVVTEVMATEDVDAGRRICRRAAGRRPQHAELPPAGSGRRSPASPCCSSAARAPRWKSCCWPPSTSSTTATRNVMLCERGIRTFEDAHPLHAAAGHGAVPAPRRRTCRSWSIPATAPATRIWCPTWPWPPSPPAPTA